MKTIQTSIKHHLNKWKPWTNRWKPAKKSMSTLEKPMNKCKCKISVPKCSHWHILAPHMRQIARQSDPGSYFFVLWPKSFFQMMPLQAFLQHLQRLYIQFMLVYIYMLKCLLIPIYVFFNPALALSTCRSSLNVFVDPYLYVFCLRLILVWSQKMLCLIPCPLVPWYQQCFAQARGCGQDLRAKLGGCKWSLQAWQVFKAWWDKMIPYPFISGYHH